MLKPKVLPLILEQALSSGVTGSILLNREGSVLSSAGSDSDVSRVVAAIASSIWSSYANSEYGELNCILTENEKGYICIVGVSKLVLVLIGDDSVPPGALKAKAMELSKYMAPQLASLV